MSRSSGKQKPFHRFLFVVYGALMLWLLFGRPRAHSAGMTYEQLLRSNINMTPFLTIRNYWWVIRHSTDRLLVRHCVINLVGNVVLFIPPGWLLPDIWKSNRNFFRFFANCLAAILLIELAQLLTLLGSFDIDDVVLNMASLILGYLAYMVSHRK